MPHFYVGPCSPEMITNNGVIIQGTLKEATSYAEQASKLIETDNSPSVNNSATIFANSKRITIFELIPIKSFSVERTTKLKEL